MLLFLILTFSVVQGARVENSYADFLPFFQAQFEKHTNFNSLTVHYSRSQGYFTKANREIEKHEPVFELPCQYLITTYDQFDDKEEWYQMISNA
jgi:hypothetical protein